MFFHRMSEGLLWFVLEMKSSTGSLPLINSSTVCAQPGIIDVSVKRNVGVFLKSFCMCQREDTTLSVTIEIVVELSGCWA